MNITTVRIAECAGAGFAGVVTSCVLAAPALAMQSPVNEPVPGTAQHHKIFDSLDGRSGPTATTAGTEATSTSGGIDWSTLATALAGGAVLTAAVALGGSQIRRHHAHPA